MVPGWLTCKADWETQSIKAGLLLGSPSGISVCAREWKKAIPKGS